MKYIKKFESSNDELKRKYIGKYTIAKSTPNELTIDLDDSEMYFLLYVVPGTCDGYRFKTYTELIVALKDSKVNIFIDKNTIKNKEKSIDHSLVLNMSLSFIDEIAVYTTTKYDDAIEKLQYIDEANKYNL